MLKKFILFLPILLATACLEESTTALDKKAFTRIYDQDQFNTSFYAIDMRETADGGYIILGGKHVEADGVVNAPFKIYILKVDQFGTVERELEIDENYISPISNLIPVNNRFYFFCMDQSTTAFLISIDALGESSQITPLDAPLTFPLAAAVDHTGSTTGLLLLSYNDSDKESIVSRISTGGNVTGSAAFHIGPGSPADAMIIQHALRTGDQFPFSVGHTSTGLFYFNGFSNYTFALVFTTLIDDNITGTINGQQENGGFSAVLPITGSTFATSIFNFGSNFFLPKEVLSNGSTTELQEGAYSFPELQSNATVKIIRAAINGKNVLVYGSNTKSKQIALYFYDEATEEFLGSEYVGYSNPFEISSLIQTTDGDLAVSGTTYVAGRLPRFCLIKISKGSLKRI
jgi:hypothetical protein